MWFWPVKEYNYTPYFCDSGPLRSIIILLIFLYLVDLFCNHFLSKISQKNTIILGRNWCLTLTCPYIIFFGNCSSWWLNATESVVLAIHSKLPNIMHRELDSRIFGVHLNHKLHFGGVCDWYAMTQSWIYPVPTQVYSGKTH